jgi:Fe-S cluster biosynthesis and repair protein YggX
MSDQQIQQRVEQFEKMTQENPDDAMGWFSLGSVYKDTGESEKAAAALRRTIELDTCFSRAYQLLGQLLVQADAHDQAAEVMTAGYTVAAERGDIMPMKAMGSLLEKIGKPVPEIKEAAPPEPISGDMVLDRRTNQPGPRMPGPPLKGAIGQFIVDHFSAPTWAAWMAQGTKVINELRLDFSQEPHRDEYEKFMMEWLGFTSDDVEAHAAPGDS